VKAIQKDFWREVKNTKNRFLSIFILVALAVAFLSGLRATAPDMKRTCDTYMDEQNFMDIQILSTLGITAEDVDELRGQPGVADAEGAYVIDAMASTQDLDIVTKVYSLPREINRLTVTDGRLPETDGECVVEEKLLIDLDVQIGDSIELLTSGDYEDSLVSREFTIVGTVISPYYISVERGTSTLGTGQVSAYLFLPEESFDMDYYTAAYVTVEGAQDEVAFSEEYDELVDGQVDALEDFGQERAQLRHDTLVGDATETLNDAQAELDDAKAEAEAELSDAWAELSDARAELDDGWAEVNDAKETLAQETADAQQKIDDAKAELTDALAELNDGEAEYADGLQKYEDGLKEYQDGLAEYEENKAEVEDGWKEYYDGLDQYNDGENQLLRSYWQLQSGEAEYSKYKQQFDSFAASYLLPGSGYESADALGQALVAEGEAGGPAHDHVQAALDNLQGQIAQLRQTVTKLEELDASLKSLQAGIAQMEEQLRQLQEQLAALEPDDPQAAELQAQITALETTLTESRSQAAALEEALENSPISLEEARAQLAALEAMEGQIPADANAVRTSYQELTASRLQLDMGWSQYTAGQQALSAAWRELQDAKAELEDADRQLADGWAELEDARIELEEAKAELDDARAELDDGWQEYEDGLQEVADAEAELTQQVADAQAEIADAVKELRSGELEYSDGLNEYYDGKAEADSKIADAEDELADARRKIADIEDGEWYILSRDSNPGYLGFGQDADRMGNLASVFPVLFFLVAALVCLTTMTRMVEEQRTQIGCLKALGYTRWKISRKYLGYGLLPSLLGGGVGLLIGYTLFPAMIFTAYQIMYDVPDIELHQYTDLSVLCLLAAAACTTVATLAACLTTLADSPANLMRPKTPKPGKRVILEYIRPLWKRLSFRRKVTARNLFRYQKRFWMTVIGIGGCTALIIAGFGLRSSILVTMDAQYEEIYLYSAQLSTSENLLDTEREALEDYLSSTPEVSGYLSCRMTSLTAESDSYSTSAYLEVVDPEQIADYVVLRTYGDKEPLTLSDDGVIIDQKLSELLDLSVGDSFTLDGDERVEVTISGITENYLGHFVYMTPSYYQQVYGEEVTRNAYLLALADSSEEATDTLFSELMQLHGVTSASRMEDTRDTYQSSMERIDFVVVIVILCAAALALVVLYNLSNINITERRRELATIKVLGFYDREVSAYVNREQVVLTGAGIGLGILFGHFLHVWLIHSVEIDLMMFGRETDPLAYVWAAGLTILFSVLVSLLAGRRMKKIDMVESLKSAE
jgi:putative ABC transport system permease protein